MRGFLAGFFAAPWHDALLAFRGCRQKRDAWVVAGFSLLAWWVYVPAHEFLHVLGCVATGGEVTRLEISPVYGGRLFARFFSFVVPHSEYPGRLSGFDTGGSDLVYLATDFAPYLLTVFVGVPLLPVSGRGRALAVRTGVALPLALAPFVSVTGDFYEMGSILVSRVAAAAVPGFDPARWRGDDVLLLWSTLPSPSWFDRAGMVASVLAGTVLAFVTYGAGRLCRSTLGRVRWRPFRRRARSIRGTPGNGEGRET